MDKLPLTSRDILADKLAILREAFPEVFTEEQIDFAKLRQSLGDFVETDSEHYSLNWAGKSEAIMNLQTPSVGTLLPVPEESVNWDTTKNLIIEGDNLEVLKLLQDSYHGKVKMIYIDPPYNTGNEFIYPDNFREGLEDYLRYSGQVDGDGIKLSTNTETSGRFHSKWLNMMYPRLFLAKNLLRDDGVIFVSIDDHEVHNLRMMLNEIFGEENFIATIIWQKSYAPRNNAPMFSDSHEYILCYVRDQLKTVINRLPATDEQLARYSNRDKDPRGDWKPGDLTVSLTSGQRGRTYQRTGQGANLYEVTSPSGKTFKPPNGRSWVYSRQKFQKMDEDNRIWWGEKRDSMPALKRFLTEILGGQIPQTIWFYKDAGHSQEASKELRQIFQEVTDVAFPTPKPVRLMQRLVDISTNSSSEEIIMDFFAGSGSLGHAVVKANMEDGGNRKFLMVQLPEPLARPLRTKRGEMKTIADILKERMKRVINQVAVEDAQGRETGTAFRVFKLSSSNFKVWDENQPPEQIGDQLSLIVNNILPSRSTQDILYEIVLKTGFPLTTPIETIPISQHTFYSIDNRTLFVCLEKTVTIETIRSMIALHPQRVICLDMAFHGNDTIKMNAKLEMQSHRIRFETV